ncbi:hypothetical protein [Pandoravirus japonicus]|uniref:Uncharacterized protein n=1 Tax=Pandoravirus japonicus TaxID=2823154 RepID=A0A811BPA5_9VIRU|nr:hypothetical protein [Pandoravirus japonicus]
MPLTRPRKCSNVIGRWHAPIRHTGLGTRVAPSRLTPLLPHTKTPDKPPGGSFFLFSLYIYNAYPFPNFAAASRVCSLQSVSVISFFSFFLPCVLFHRG